MKLTKEQVYINLQGKTKEELTDLYWLLKNNNQDLFHNDLSIFIEEYYKTSRFLEFYCGKWGGGDNLKTEVTIEQLKQIIKPMGTFTPIAMKCTQEQFDAVKPKLVNCTFENLYPFDKCEYLTNNYTGKYKNISNLTKLLKRNQRTVHEEWNEEIFLKACGIEVETLQDKEKRLANELYEVRKKIEEENKPKVGDICKFWDGNKNIFMYGKLHSFRKEDNRYISTTKNCFWNCEKITKTELIKLLENE